MSLPLFFILFKRLPHDYDHIVALTDAAAPHRLALLQISMPRDPPQ